MQPAVHTNPKRERGSFPFCRKDWRQTSLTLRVGMGRDPTPPALPTNPKRERGSFPFCRKDWRQTALTLRVGMGRNCECQASDASIPRSWDDPPLLGMMSRMLRRIGCRRPSPRARVGGCGRLSSLGAKPTWQIVSRVGMARALDNQESERFVAHSLFLPLIPIHPVQ